MPKTLPVLLHVINAATGEPAAVSWTPGTLAEYFDRYDADQQYASGTCAVNGMNTLIAGPGAGYRLVVTKVFLQSLTANLTTAILYWGDATEIGGGVFNTQYGWLQTDFNWPAALTGPENGRLALSLDGANSFRYMVVYYTVPV